MQAQSLWTIVAAALLASACNSSAPKPVDVGAGSAASTTTMPSAAPPPDEPLYPADPALDADMSPSLDTTPLDGNLPATPIAPSPAPANGLASLLGGGGNNALLSALPFAINLLSKGGGAGGLSSLAVLMSGLTGGGGAGLSTLLGGLTGGSSAGALLGTAAPLLGQLGGTP